MDSMASVQDLMQEKQFFQKLFVVTSKYIRLVGIDCQQKKSGWLICNILGSRCEDCEI